MTRFARSRFSRFVSLLLSALILHSAPGLRVYEAAAQSFTSKNPAAGSPARVQLSLGAASNPISQLIPGQGLSASPFAASPFNVVPAAASAAAASENAAVDALGSNAARAAASSPRFSAAAKSEDALAATRLSIGLDAAGLNRTYDASRDIKEGASAVPGAASAAAADPRLPSASETNSARPSASVPPSAPQGPAQPSRGRVALGLGLAALGAAAAFFTAPWAAAAAGAFLAAHVHYAVSALVLKSLWIGLGAMAGFSAFQVETWKAYPKGIAAGAKSAAASGFDLFANLGLVFNSALRPNSNVEALSAELPLNIRRYPVAAWPGVLVGYVASPISYVFGAAYQLVGTPVLASLRGLHEVTIGFFPWTRRVFDLAGRVIVHGFPFIGGMIWGGFRTAGTVGWAGATTLAGPVLRDALVDYTSKTLPGTVSRAGVAVFGYVAALALGVVGFVVALAFSPATLIYGALQKGFELSGVSPGANAYFTRWLNNLKNDDAVLRLADHRYPNAVDAPGAQPEALGVQFTRVLNDVAMSLILAVLIPALSFAAFTRAEESAVTGKTLKEPQNHFGDGRPQAVVERAVQATGGFIVPSALAVLGAAGALYAFIALGVPFLALHGFVIHGLPLIGAYLASTGIGAFLGLAASQPQAYKSVPSVFNSSMEGALLTSSGWEDFWRRTGAAFGYETAGTGIFGKSLAVLSTAFSAIPNVLIAVAYVPASITVKAAWNGFDNVATRFFPFLKRAFIWAVKVVKHIALFVAGFVVGAVWGELRAAGWTAFTLLKPLGEIFRREEQSNAPEPSKWQLLPASLMALALVVPTLAVAALGLAVGALFGAPFALVGGAATAGHAADIGPKSEAFYEFWENTVLARVARRVGAVNSNVLKSSDRGMTVWRVFVRAGNVILSAVPTAVLAVAAAGAETVSLSEHGAKAPAIDDGAEPYAPISHSAPAPSAPSAPAARTHSALIILSGVVGLVAAVAGFLHFQVFAALLPGFVALEELSPLAEKITMLATLLSVPFLGTAAGLALSQTSFWKNVGPETKAQGEAGGVLAFQYWDRATDAASAALTGAKRGATRTDFLLPYIVLGDVSAVAWAVAGAAFGASTVFWSSAYVAARQVVYGVLPWLKRAFQTAMKVLRRVVPFVFGLFAGLFSGVAGSAAFGALLLGRPYFKYVVAAPIHYDGPLGFLGMVALKTLALAAGLVFGLIGVVAGVVVASPYAAASAVAFAFRFADIGGPVQRFFDQWTYGALRQEMRRLNKFTDSFKFAPGETPVSAGWMRVLQVGVATLVAAVAATFTGLFVSYARSLHAAYVGARDKAPLPPSSLDNDSDWAGKWTSSKARARGSFRWAIAGAVLGTAAWLFTSWTPFGLAGLALVAAATGLGAALALGAAGVLAFAVLMLWIGGQLR